MSTVASLAALGVAAPGALASSSPTASSPVAGAAAVQRTATVSVQVKRFAVRAGKPVAQGTATAKLTGVGGSSNTVRKAVTLQVTGTGNCRILQLNLNALDLTLLGVNVHLDPVELRITGQRNGGILGRLFCSLASTRIASAATVSSLNRALREQPMRPLSFGAHVAQAPGAGNTCRILDLVLGPLHLNLLGLVVDLNRVHLTITAIRGGGLLGDLLCGLTSTPLPTTPTVPAVPGV